MNVFNFTRVFCESTKPTTQNVITIGNSVVSEKNVRKKKKTLLKLRFSFYEEKTENYQQKETF